MVDYIVGKILPPKDWMADIANVDYYNDKDWLTQFNEDNEKMAPRTAAYSPFTLWRRPPFSSPTINVDLAGRRVVPGSECQKESYTIFVFGGSAAWGTGAPDWGTIPAYLHQQLKNRFHSPLCIVNFGESAWNSNQEVIQLMISLKNFQRPDLAIFYHGWNDVHVALKTGNPYLHDHYQLISARVNRRGREWRSVLALLTPNFIRLGFLNFIFQPQIAGPKINHKHPQFQESLVSNYRENVNIVQALAKSYRFKVHFFWQPDLTRGSRPRHPSEQKIIPNSDIHGIMKNLTDKVGHQNPDFTDLGGALDEFKEQAYIDPVHVTPKANEVIATHLIKALDQSKKLPSLK